jgi:hypothetical protein
MSGHLSNDCYKRLRLQKGTKARENILRFLFVAAKIVRHAGAVLVRYSDHYAEQGKLGRLMDRLRGIVQIGDRFVPVLASALRL